MRVERARTILPISYKLLWILCLQKHSPLLLSKLLQFHMWRKSLRRKQNTSSSTLSQPRSASPLSFAIKCHTLSSLVATPPPPSEPGHYFFSHVIQFATPNTGLWSSHTLVPTHLPHLPLLPLLPLPQPPP